MDNENSLTLRSPPSIPEPDDAYWAREQANMISYLKEQEKKFGFNEKQFLEWSQRLTDWGKEHKRLAKETVEAEARGDRALAMFLYQKKEVYLKTLPWYL